MPKYPLHNKIRFENLQIDYIDHSVITFLRSNQQIFDKGINLDLFMSLSDDDQPIWNAFACGIWSIFVPNIRHLNFHDGRQLENLRRHTSPTVLSNFDIISIHFDDLLPDSIADDGPNATSGQVLSKWLHIPTKNGQPKQLSFREYDHPSDTKGWVNSFKEAFLRATISSTNYIIRLDVYESMPMEPFELMNERTNEMLTLEKEEDEDENVDEEYDDDGKYIGFLLKRWQIGKTIQWEDENLDNLNNVDISLYEEFNIGPMSPPKAGKTNAKNRLKVNPGPSGQ